MKPAMTPQLQQRMLAASILRQPNAQPPPNMQGAVGPPNYKMQQQAHPRGQPMPAMARALALAKLGGR